MIKVSVLCVLLFSAHTFGRAVRKFPEGFQFGVATSSYQIEGAWNVSGKGENIWDHATHNTDLVMDKSNGDIACNSYNLYKRDIEMLKELGVDYYRFSLSWARILPTGLIYEKNNEGIAYYNSLIDELIKNDIEPVVTIYHWELPQKLQELGGWTNPIMAEYFQDFASFAFKAFGDRVKLWLTFNEPKEICLSGYGLKDMAPAYGFSGIAEYQCAHYLLISHAKVYHMYHEKFNDDGLGRISLSLNTDWFEPEDNSTENVLAAERGIEFTFGWYANPIFSKDGDYPAEMKSRILKKSLSQGFVRSRLPSFTTEEVALIIGTFDFFGLNHYTTRMARNRSETDTEVVPSFFDDVDIYAYQKPEWPGASSPWLKVVPWGFKKLLTYIKDKYDDPEIIVFENGYSDYGELNDQGRVDYYSQYMNAMLDAMEEGASVTAYTAWSLMDNFEWFAGYTEKFGLYGVDFNDPNRTRTPKDSAKFYSDVIHNRVLPQN